MEATEGLAMSALKKPELLSEEDYLAGELVSPMKHEFLGGVVYAMAGGRNVHNLIATNTVSVLHGCLRGQRRRAYNSDTKIRVRVAGRVRFYYPDSLVVCEPNLPGDTFHDNPAVITEVLSASTRRTDEGEKLDAYTSIPSLRVYLMIEQDRPFIVAHRRTDAGFIREVYAGMDAVVPLPEIGAALPLAEAYEAIVFVPEEEPEEPA